MSRDHVLPPSTSLSLALTPLPRPPRPFQCDQLGNKGAYIKFTAPEMKPDIHTFEAVPHPEVPPMAYTSAMSRFGL